MTSKRQTAEPSRRQIIGILGGLGPYAHIDLERQLLAAARQLVGAVHDQDFPEWILSSVPRALDPTTTIQDADSSPLPWLVRSLRRLESRTGSEGERIPGADFVIIASNAAHHYLDALRQITLLPLIDMIGEGAAHLEQRLEPGSRVGLLATTATLEGGLYHRALKDRGLRPRSLLDLPNGAELQRELVMAAIYGRAEDCSQAMPGLKTHGSSEPARASLLEAAEILVQDLGCATLVAGCAEIPLALTESNVAGVALVNPLEVVAEVAIALAYGLGAGQDESAPRR